jgi:hypothetical protein
MKRKNVYKRLWRSAVSYRFFNNKVGRIHEAAFPFSAFCRLRYHLLGGYIALFAAVAMTSCAPVYSRPQEIEARPPSISYNYTSDADLVEARSKAREYCSQYASMPANQGEIKINSDGMNTVTFECVNSTVATPSAPPPMQYNYSSDSELLQAMDSAESYCERSDQAASTSITSNPDGSKTLVVQCIPR